MPSTYTLNNGIELIATGEQSGTWGDTTNTNFELLDTSLDGQVTVTLASTGSSGSPNTLPVSDGAASNGRNRLVIFDDSSDLGGTAFVQLTPNDAEKIIYVRNSLSGSRSILLFQGTYNASNDYEVPAGTTAVVFFNGAGAGAVAANVFNNAHFDNLNIVGDVTIGDDLTLNSDGAIINIGADNDLQITHSGTAGAITNATGDLTLDVAGDIILDADGADFKFRDGGAGFFTISNSSLDAVLKVEQSNEDFIIKGNDGGSEITALTLDMSEAGAATFNAGVTLSGDLTVDTDTLYVDSTNNRVGVNEATPLEALHVTTSDSGTTISKTVGNTSGPVFVLDNTDDTADNLAAIQFASSGSSSTDVTATTGIYSINTGRGGTYSYGDLAFYTTNSGGTHSEAMRIDSSQRVLINTDTSRVVGGSAQAVTQIYNTSNGALLSLFRDQASNNGGAIIRGGKARNGAIVQDNDTIFSLEAVAHDGTDMGSFAGTIAFLVDGTPGANDTPSRIAFYTTTDGSSSGSERMRIDNAGNVGINTTAPSDYTANGNNLVVADVNVGITLASTSTVGSGALYFADGTSGSQAYRGIINYLHSSDAMGFHTGAAQAMTIDSGQRVLVGYTANTSVADFNSAVQVVGQGTADFHGAAIAAVGFSNNSNGAYLNFGSGRSNTAGTFTSVANDDTIGQINFAAADGTDMNSRAALIMAQIDAAPSSNDTPGRIIFSTTADGASSPTEVMRLTNDRVLKLNSSWNAGSLTTFPSYSGEGAYLKGYVNGGGAGPYPRYLDIAALGDSSWGGVIRFLGNKDATATAVENARIDRDGHFKIGSVSGAGKLTVSNNQTAVDNLELAAFSGSDVNQRLTINNFFCGSDEDRVGLLFENQGTGNMRVWMGDDLKLYSKSGNPTSDNDGNYFVQVNSSGNIAMPSGNGIDFSATSNGSGTTTSEVLDDYEEGTWTPALFGGTTAGTMTGNTAGRYTKIGQQVFIEFRIDGVTLSGAVGTIHISGLPFTFSYGTNNTYSVATVTQMHKFNFTPDSRQSFYASSGGTTLFGLESRNGLNWVDWSVTNTTDLYMNVSMFYITTQ